MKKKNTDEVQICIDSRDLNEAIQRPQHYPKRTVEEIVPRTPNAKFTVLDTSSAF